MFDDPEKTAAFATAMEFCKLWWPFSPHPKINAANIWEIGHGHTRTVRAAMNINESGADQLLHDDLMIAWRTVNRLVLVDLSDDQRAALVCLVFQIGSLNFEQSRALAMLNRGFVDAVPVLIGRYKGRISQAIANLFRQKEEMAA